MKRIVLTTTLLFCFLIVSTEVVHAEENGEKRHSLLSGLLEQLGSTVDETVNAVGGLVGTVVEGVDKTVDDTVSFTRETVETLVDSEEKKPVSKIVENTVDHVGKTVENVEPVLKNTTNTVDTVTKEVIGVTDELPEIPVVTPVVDELGKVVGKTTGTLTGTVDKTVETVQELPVVIEKVTKPIVPERKPDFPEVSPLRKVEKSPIEPAIEEHPMIGEMPVKVEKLVKAEAADPVEQSEPVEQTKLERIESVIEKVAQPSVALEDFALVTNPIEEEAIAEKPQDVPINTEKVEQTSGFTVTSVDRSLESVSKEPDMPAIPLNPKSVWKDNPVVMTTSTSSISTASVVSAGFTDFVQGIVNWLDRQTLLEGRQWIHSSESMRNQWTHAPPGQPPQQTSFLQININSM